MSSPSGDIKVIVSHLKAAPFHRSEGLVDFSKKTPLELLQVVNDVFSEIDESQKKDLREEQKEQMAIRMLEFVTVLGYKIEGDMSEQRRHTHTQTKHNEYSHTRPARIRKVARCSHTIGVSFFFSLSLFLSFFSLFLSGQFGENFMRGNPLVIYPFLQWVLEGFEKNKTRGYLARYLRPFSIPEEHFADNQIVNMYQQYQTRQSEFKELHRELEEVRKGASNPTHLQQEVNQVANEIDQLKNKLERGHSKISNDSQYASNMEGMLEATSKLRQEQEIQSKVESDKHEQQMKLQHSEQIRHSTARKFQEMNHSDMSRMEPFKLLQNLREEVQRTRELLQQKDTIISEREKQLKHLSKMAGSTTTSGHQEFTHEDLHDLQREQHSLESEVDELLQRRENSMLANDSKITFVRDRLSNVEKKREKLSEQLQELEDEKLEAERDLKKVQSEFKSLIGQTEEEDRLPNGQPKPKTEQAMKEYMNELNRKTQKYKTLKSELETERSEIQVLIRTEEILRSRDANIAEFNTEQEKRLGVVGYSSAQENLEAISEAKSQVDTSKGETLEEMSDIISKIQITLKKKKEKLAPQIKDLRSVRQDFETLEGVYKTKKASYENMSLSYESERLKLEQDVQQNQQSYQEEESQFHFLHCFTSITQARLEQVQREEKDGSYGTLYERSILEQEAQTKVLRNEKKTITEKHEDHVAQRSMFQALKGLLNKKLELTKNPPPGSSGGSNAQQQQQHHQGYAGGYHSAGGAGYGGSHGVGGGYGGSGSSQYLDQLAEESDRLVLEQ